MLQESRKYRFDGEPKRKYVGLKDSFCGFFGTNFNFSPVQPSAERYRVALGEKISAIKKCWDSTKRFRARKATVSRKQRTQTPTQVTPIPASKCRVCTRYKTRPRQSPDLTPAFVRKSRGSNANRSPSGRSAGDKHPNKG